MRIAIAGYGNLGRGVEAAVTNAPDMELVGIFTRRDPASVSVATDTPVLAWEDLPSYVGKVDVADIGKEQGENKSPQLSWEPVEGANAYGILMIDTDAGNWLHWKTGMVTTAGIPLGYAGADTYVGPYPPAGTTHSYTIYVAALREADANVIGFLDGRNDYADYTPDKLLCSMDVTDGGSAGNVIAVGTITGTYSTAK